MKKSNEGNFANVKSLSRDELKEVRGGVDDSFDNGDGSGGGPRLDVEYAVAV